MGTKICCYVRPNGAVCESAALRNSDMCYWHHRDRERGRKRKNASDIQIPTLENATAVQVALEEVVRALVDDRIDPHRGKAILYGLQIAAHNATNVFSAPLCGDRKLVELAVAKPAEFLRAVMK